jgi:hypothetical protein
MRTLLIVAFLGACWTGSATAQQPIPMAPELAKFMSTPEEERAVKTMAFAGWRKILPSCGNPQFVAANVIVHVPPKFDSAGRPTSGSWQVVSRLQGCGQTRIINLQYAVASNGQPARFLSLPGTTAADERLRRDGLAYAKMAMAKIAPADCKDFQYVDTVFEQFTGAAQSTGRPWTEKWTVRACGVEGVVRMHFIPNAAGTQILTNTDETVRVR